MTNEEFARALGTAVRTVAKWNAEPTIVPVAEMQRALDTLLQRATPEVQARFASILDARRSSAPRQRDPNQEDDPDPVRRLVDAPDLDATLTWLDEHAGWPSGTARSHVAEEIRRLDGPRWRQEHTSSRVGRTAIARALVDFYQPTAGYLLYRATVDGASIETSILTRPQWLNLRLVLNNQVERSSLVSDAGPPVRLDEPGVHAAIRRIAHTLLTGGRMVNAPLYSLRRIDISPDGVAADYAVTDFLSYALTLDLLESELIDAIAAGRSPTPTALPLRWRYLPDLAAVTSLNERLCAGGPAALFVAARKHSRRRPAQPDYLLLVQHRSARTLNANRRLAVIPKAFHQPLVDFTEDTLISATIEREMEEELFGREDLDDTRARLRADPLHTARMSAPMRWLAEHPDPAAWRIECTGFGLNLVSGNFEFASMIVVEDDEWWERFGGAVEANWEAEGIRRFSTLDRQGVTRLVQDDNWSNEALFALLQGLRRLAETGGARVDLPQITLEI
jgi:hypothetical protein